MSNSKRVKNYLYEGLGFPVLIKEAEFIKIRGKWLLKVDVEEVANRLIKALPNKPVGLTGAEVRFIRTYFEFSKRKFAEELNVTHTAIGNWEDAGQKRAKIDSHVEISLRAFVKLRLHDEKNFSAFYRELLNDAKHFGDNKKNEPVQIAL
jgi:DNA-binding transcriptional regulator YiaG